jgi:flagellin-like protein
MPNKAVSPLIATVLVIGFAIALSGIMMTWGTSFVKDIQERSEKSSLKDIACTKDVGLNIKGATVFGNKIKLVVENLGQMNMDKLNILLIGSDGGDNIVTASGISAGGIQSFSVALDPNKIGTFNQVEIIPYITFEGEQIACKDAVDKEDNLGIDTDGLIAYYKLDGDAKDSAGNNNGVINGNPVTVSGVFGNALDFDGVDDYVNCGSSSSLNSPLAMTISAWYFPTDISGGRRARIGRRHGGGFLTISGDRFGYESMNNAGSWTNNLYSPSGTVALNQWQHFAFAFTADGTVTLYKNGTVVASKGVIGSQGGNGSPCVIGTEILGGWGTPQYFKGIIDEVKIYNKAKTY